MTCETAKDCEVGRSMSFLDQDLTVSDQTSTTRTAASGATAPGLPSLVTRARPRAREPWRTVLEVRRSQRMGMSDVDVYMFRSVQR